MPEITVLMPVRNGEKYIKEAIDSILKQSFIDFELLIIDDGSTDNTISIIKTYSDSRIRLIKQKPNFIKALNKGLNLAEGEFIARMDADDIMHTERLRIQYKRMRSYPDISVSASWIKQFRDNSVLLPPFQFGNGYIEHPILKMLKNNILAHPSVMIRKSFLSEQKLKYQNYPQAEDYKLWFEIAKAGGKFFVEPQYLLNYRVSDTQISAINRKSVLQQSVVIKKEILDYLLKNLNDNKIPLRLYKTMEILEKKEMVSPNETFQLLGNLLFKTMKLEHG
ncbi:MAG: glycosyltransferase [Prevotella sp.]|jgi:glycosyltransferase involved in cell wall biosynthesis|nr:glycosyltransferase [Prevotella sp.]